MKNSTAENIGYITIIFGVIALLIFLPPISFGLGYFSGLILKWTCGDVITNGLNMMLGNITRHTFVTSDIPLFCGIMTTIGGFFKAINTTKKN